MRWTVFVALASSVAFAQREPVPVEVCVLPSPVSNVMTTSPDALVKQHCPAMAPIGPSLREADGVVERGGMYLLFRFPSDGVAPMEIEWTGKIGRRQVFVSAWDGRFWINDLLGNPGQVVTHVLQSTGQHGGHGYVLTNRTDGPGIEVDAIRVRRLGGTPPVLDPSGQTGANPQIRFDRSWTGSTERQVIAAADVRRCDQRPEPALPTSLLRTCQPVRHVSPGDRVTIVERKPGMGVPAGDEPVSHVCSEGGACDAIPAPSGWISIGASALSDRAPAQPVAPPPPPRCDRPPPSTLRQASVSPGEALDRAKASLAAGDPVSAIDVLWASYGRGTRDALVAAALGALLHDADPQRSAELKAAAGLELPPFPTIPPALPARKGKPAYVNVASAGVRKQASDKGELLGRIPIGTPVKVTKASGDFVHVTFKHPAAKAKAGFIHKDLLTLAKPTVDGFLAEAAKARASGPDHEATILWRALNLDPRRRDVLARLIEVAFHGKRYGMAVDAVELATRAGAFPLAAKQPFPDASTLRLTLFRIALTRNAAALRPLLEGIRRSVQVTAYDQIGVSSAEYYAKAMGDPASPLWPALLDVAASAPGEGDGGWNLTASGVIHLQGNDCDGWRIVTFELPGGHHPQECAGDCEPGEEAPSDSGDEEQEGT